MEIKNEEKNERVNQYVSIKNRAECNLTGVDEVLQFNDKLLIINTSMGRLEINGNNLRVSGYDEKRGELTLSGEIDALHYSNIKSVGKTTKGIVGRMFR